jgi:hypothetical protein
LPDPTPDSFSSNAFVLRRLELFLRAIGGGDCPQWNAEGAGVAGIEIVDPGAEVDVAGRDVDFEMEGKPLGLEEGEVFGRESQPARALGDVNDFSVAIVGDENHFEAAVFQLATSTDRRFVGSSLRVRDAGLSETPVSYETP